MKKKLIYVAPIAIGVAGLAYLIQPGFEDPGCACLPPPTLEQIAAWIETANKGDNPDSVAAMGQAYEGYLLRGQNVQAEIWKQRAITAGDSVTIANLGNEALSSVYKLKNTSEKQAKLSEALDLLERAYPNRAVLADLRRSGFVSDLRAARAGLTIIRDGVEPWTNKANAGDAGAAYRLASYYLNVELDQTKRSFWEEKAARLGDPEFAWKFACCWRATKADLVEGKQVIQTARANRKVWTEVGDIWMQSVLLEELDNAEFRIDQRLTKLAEANR